MVVFLPCYLCAKNHFPCHSGCLLARFFPTHMSTSTEQLTSVFDLGYIFVTLLLRNIQPQTSSILFVKNLFQEAHMRWRNPVNNPLKRYHFQVKFLENKLEAQLAEIQQLRIALHGPRRFCPCLMRPHNTTPTILEYGSLGFEYHV